MNEDPEQVDASKECDLIKDTSNDSCPHDVASDNDITGNVVSEGNSVMDVIADLSPLSFTINQEKKELKGEDADPLLLTIGDIGYIGVFDGMGGAGASEYAMPDGLKHTGAYLASRLVANLMAEFVTNNPTCDIDTNLLCQFIKERLNQYALDNNIKPSGLRSSIIRVLPTTLAVIGYQRAGTQLDINSYWCGDSRNYYMTKDGLKQISTDDLKTIQDPMENLRNDEALSNCICQDKEFTINKINVGKISLPVILYSATDGCFGYLETPMHFEYLLLDTLMCSQNIDEWKSNIIETLKPISGDDFSMAVTMIGLEFDVWKEQMKSRYQTMQSVYVEAIKKLHSDSKQQIKDAEDKLYNGITELWNNYKINYLNQ